MLLRPGNTGSNTAADHIEVLAAAIAQVPARMRSRLLVRVDGARGKPRAHQAPAVTGLAAAEGAVHLRVDDHRRRRGGDRDAAGLRVAGRPGPGLDQDRNAEEEKHVAEITHLMSRGGKWPEGLRWIARRAMPSRRHTGNLTAYEKATGWLYSITCTNFPGTGIPGVPGSHHPQVIDVVHREHAVVEDGVRRGKAMGLRNLPRRGWSTAAGSWPRASPLTWPPGRGSWASTTRTGWKTPSRARSATGCGTYPPASSATPASGS